MRIERKEVLELLQQVPLFSHLEESTLDWVSALFQLEIFHDGEIIFDIGEPSQWMYLVYEGHVQLTALKGEKLCLCARLKRGDVFGEESLLYDDPRFYTATAKGNVILLRWTAESYLGHHENLPGFAQRLDVMINSRSLAVNVPLKWLQEDEYVHVMMRRHWAILMKKMVAPSLFGIGGLIFSGLMQWAWLPGQSYGFISMVLVVIMTALWLLWNFFDWHNDYFIVTNKRVVWIEQVALIYESRQEAPLRTIMSVGIQKSRIGSLLDMADVVVMTYVGTIRLQNLAFAETVASLVESYWHHSDSQSRRDESLAMAQILNEKLDLPWDEEEETREGLSTPETEEPLDVEKEPGFLRWLLSDFIRLRYESGGVITYRKHWFILIRKTWIPSLLIGFGLVILVFQLIGRVNFMQMTGGIALTSMLLFFLFLWLVYQYADWRNDQFKLTFDQLVDIDRKPLGKIRRRSAPLENVLSIEYKRKGFWGFLLNFGTVYITVGNMKLTFDYVYNPSEVQQDIFYRMGERLESKRQFEIDSERERVSEWIASYHRKMRKLENQKDQRMDSQADNTKKI